MQKTIAAIVTLELIAIAMWLGGLLTLGAIAAPVVFGMVPSPSSADAMTVVFRRFDVVAVVCVVSLLMGEATLAMIRRPLARIDFARAVVALVGAICVLGEAAFVSPKIAGLHASGAIRGLGVDGLALESAHAVAERLGKAQALSAAVLLALIAFDSIGRGAPGEGCGAVTRHAHSGFARADYLLACDILEPVRHAKFAALCEDVWHGLRVGVSTWELTTDLAPDALEREIAQLLAPGERAIFYYLSDSKRLFRVVVEG